MRPTNLSLSKVSPTHQAKLAYVYVRQSSLGQVIHHGESTDLQYQLVQRAGQLGWPADRVKVIDEDLGQSATSTTARTGFQHLIAEIGLGRVGLVLSLDASRLARNNQDWYQLLDLCAIFGTLLADAESLYDPSLYADRMLLGLAGMMSEAELHQLRLRLQAGARNKAQRGELRLPLPVGLVRLADGTVILDPDEEIQARLRLVFAKFKELGTARAVLRYLRRQKLPLPSRPIKGPPPYSIVWQAPTNHAILRILSNPTYAGAYTYGRTQVDLKRYQAGGRGGSRLAQPIDKWPVLLHNVYPAYLSWEEFLTNQRQLQANRYDYFHDQPGTARQGTALLQGLVRCARCGVRMRVYYRGSQGQYPNYRCDYAHHQRADPLCQQIRADALDREVERLLLAALAPDQLALALAALEQLEAEYASLRRQWDLRLERARYETERAARQYQAVEPENRLVARSLERNWEEKLRTLEQVEQDYQAWLKQEQLELTAADRQQILALGQDLPLVWHAATTTPADRKQIVRLLIKEVLVDARQTQGRIQFQINWQTGAITHHWLTRSVSCYADHTDQVHLAQRLEQLLAEEKFDQQIAAILNAEGFQSARARPFNGRMVGELRRLWQLSGAKATGPAPLQWPDGTYSVTGAAAALGVIPGTIFRWLKQGRLQGHQLAKGTPWKIELDPDQIAAIHKSTQ